MLVYKAERITTVVIILTHKRPSGLEPFKVGAYLLCCRDVATGSVVSCPSCSGSVLCLSAPSASSSRAKLGTSNRHVLIIRIQLRKVGFFLGLEKRQQHLGAGNLTSCSVEDT